MMMTVMTINMMMMMTIKMMMIMMMMAVMTINMMMMMMVIQDVLELKASKHRAGQQVETRL